MKDLFQQKLPRSVVPWVRLFGSLKLAVVLLVIIAAACAVATVFESRFDAKVARYYIYDAPWFTLWLLLLCLNLFCAALTRWPWKRRHLGFVITHAGIILMLAGAMIGRWKGYEGMITLDKGETPASQLVIDETVLLIESPADGEFYRTPLPVEVRRPTTERPRYYDVPGSRMKLKIDGFSDKLAMRQVLVDAAPDDVDAAPGVQLEMSSAMMGQTMEIPLLLAPAQAADFNLFGLAHIRWMAAFPVEKPKSPEEQPRFRETQMVFANFPQSPVWHSTSGQASGCTFVLERGDDGTFTLDMHFPSGEERRMPLADLLDKPFSPGIQGLEIHVVRFWNDLKMVEGKPVNASDAPNNPAILVMVNGASQPVSQREVPELWLAPGKTPDAVLYRTKREGEFPKTGELKPGESFRPGWADWSVRLVRRLPRAVLDRKVVEEEGNSVMMEAGLVSGIRVALVDGEGKESEPVWIVSGTTRTLEQGGQAVRVGFGLQVKRLDFAVGLDNFEVPRDEGTETPSNFISTIRFYGKDGVAGPETVEMNHPASYPEGWWGALTGLNHKFSQAGWNPQNLNRTTLQVLHDPGWFFKWTGSLLICGGILMLFYLKPGKGGRRGAVESGPGTAKLGDS